jgi:hypothetical protein
VSHLLPPSIQDWLGQGYGEFSLVFKSRIVDIFSHSRVYVFQTSTNQKSYFLAETLFNFLLTYIRNLERMTTAAPPQQELKIPSDGELADVPSTNGLNGRPSADELRRVVSATLTNDISADDPFKLSSQNAYASRKVKVITIGAGFSGLLIAHKLQHRFPEMRDIVEHKIFEMRSDVGGTWLANHYPGVQCDVPAHIYVCLL